MKSFSIIVPVYNEPRLVIECLKSLATLDYKNYEVVIVNDASTDETRKKVENFIINKKKIRLINNKKNQGRVKSRLIGAKAAKFLDLLFIDARVTIPPNTLNHLSRKKTNILIPGNEIQKANIYGKILHNLKTRLIWKKSETKITRDNFDQTPKGMTACYFKKSLFLKSISNINKIDKNISDDTKLFYEVLKFEKQIIRDKNFQITYHYRENLSEILLHTFNRGPKFVDYYFKPGKRFFPHLVAICLLTIISPIFFIFEFSVLLGAIIIIAAYISQTVGQFFISLYFLPIIATAFYFGLIKGIIIKLIR